MKKTLWIGGVELPSTFLALVQLVVNCKNDKKERTSQRKAVKTVKYPHLCLAVLPLTVLVTVAELISNSDARFNCCWLSKHSVWLLSFSVLLTLLKKKKKKKAKIQ